MGKVTVALRATQGQKTEKSPAGLDNSTCKHSFLMIPDEDQLKKMDTI